MLARYYGAGLSRFLSTDPVGGKVRQPQSWNRYAYVLNNPLAYIDPSGESVEKVELKTEGENKVPNPSATQGTALSQEDTKTLGPKETSTSVLNAVNVEATVSEGDSPGNYEFRQEAATVAVVEGAGSTSVNPNDAPGAGNTATVGNQLVMWDAPGVKVEGTVPAGKTIEFSGAFKTYAVDKSTGEQSGPTLYWGVTIKQGPEGVTKNVSGPITPQAYEQVKQRAGGGSP
jgi:uncharacterized protein RhaS with RHS repeats